jgi:hypothetical protein
MKIQPKTHLYAFEFAPLGYSGYNDMIRGMRKILDAKLPFDLNADGPEYQFGLSVDFRPDTLVEFRYRLTAYRCEDGKAMESITLENGEVIVYEDPEPYAYGQVTKWERMSVSDYHHRYDQEA